MNGHLSPRQGQPVTLIPTSQACYANIAAAIDAIMAAFQIWSGLGRAPVAGALIDLVVLKALVLGIGLQGCR